MKYEILVLAALVFLTASVSAAEVEVFTQQDWNQGNFSGTSADRNDNSGNLGLGYRNGSPTDSLIGYWRLDRSVSGSGGTVKDYSGNGNDGTARNGVTTGAQGVFSTKAFDFDGSNDYVDLGQVHPNNGGDMSVSAWVKSPTSQYDQSWATVSSYDDFILGARTSGTDRFGFIVYCGSCSDSWNENGGTTTIPNPEQWNHFVGVYDDSQSEVRLYLNGDLINTGSDTRSGGSSNPVELMHREREPAGSQHQSGKIDEVRIYGKALEKSEVEELYLQGKPYHGNYTKKISDPGSQVWNEIEVDASSIPANTDVDAVFRAKDSSDNLVDEQVIELQEGKKNYSLDVSDSEKAEIVFNGSSSDVTSSWGINGFKVFAGFCDYRGPKNECVMNSSKQLESKTYQVSSIFESRSTAVFEAFSRTSVLNISNSSRLSGTWKGSFDIRSNPVTIEPGATFIPGNGGIVVGE